MSDGRVNITSDLSLLASGIRGCSAAEMPKVPKARDSVNWLVRLVYSLLSAASRVAFTFFFSISGSAFCAFWRYSTAARSSPLFRFCRETGETGGQAAFSCIFTNS